MKRLDLNFVRARIPAFGETPLRDVAHFENAGGTYPCEPVVARIKHYYTKVRVQPYYDFYPSNIAGDMMNAARGRLASWLNMDSEEVHFGPSTSMNTYVISQALRQHLKPGDEVIVTNQDHEANIGAWRRLEEAGMVIREWQVDPGTGELHQEGLENLLNERTRVVAFTHCSNLIGTIHPADEWVNLIHDAGAIAIVDGVSMCPHGLANPRFIRSDIYLLSLYKVYGPHLGVMVMKNELNQKLPFQCHYFNQDKPNARFTPAGPDHAQIAATNGVIDYFESLYMHHFPHVADATGQAEAIRTLFRFHEIELLQPLLDYLKGHRRIRMFGQLDATKRAPTVCFTNTKYSSRELAHRLSQRMIAVGVGDFYARRLVEALGVDPKDGLVRVSFVHYTSMEDIERLMENLDYVLK